MKQKGVVALEFLLLFPIVIALVYGAAVYGVAFSWQVQMQLAVDRSTAAVMHLDRSSADDVSAVALAKATEALGPAALRLGTIENTTPCVEEDGVLITCRLSKSVEGLQIKLWGGFPPLPKELTATASVAY